MLEHAGTDFELAVDLAAVVGSDDVLTSPLDLVRYASDASPYLMYPRAVVRPRNSEQVAALMAVGRRSGVPLVFRAAGTSLNGQSQSDGILVDVRRHWTGHEVLDERASRVRVRPGTVLGRLNAALAPYGRRLGPDPASTQACTIGGVVANNSGGMRCGTVEDSYSTVRSMTFVLPSGTVVDSAAPDAEERFAAAEPELAAGLLAIRDELRADSALAERVRRKFAIKNTTGYRLCAFLDADTPVEILRRLMIGSEGTLGFVSEVEFETVPVGRLASTALLHFASNEAAAVPVAGLVEAGAKAVEIMAAATLMVAAHNMPGTPEAWKELPPDSAALLVDARSDDPAELDRFEAAAAEVLAGADLIAPPQWSRDPEHAEMLWRVREGMFGLIGGFRALGSLLISEDVCVPPERVAEAAAQIKALLAEHGFLPGVAGHASAGNLHFLLTPTFPQDAERYDTFMRALVDLIVDEYDGSLKAEHGTGRNMAPWVEREWGAEATALMWRVKELCDPDGVLAPGVVLDRDPDAHLRNLKSTPSIGDEEADKCVECGFCEPVCPSRDLTTTPRQRILIRRELARQPGGSKVARALAEQEAYASVQTCAGDGTCKLACPVSIDTGRLMKGLRKEAASPRARKAGVAVAKRYGLAERAARAGLRAGPLAAPASTLGRKVLGEDTVPSWLPSVPHAARRLPVTQRAGAAAVYFPACINRIFGRPRGGGEGSSVPDTLVALSARAGLPVWIPEDVAGTCCATPWSSKGLAEGARTAAAAGADALWRWSDEGALPVVVDATSCTLGLLRELDLDDERAERHARVEVLDAIEWAHDRLLPALEVKQRVGSTAIHPTCAARHLGLPPKLEALMGAVSDAVVVPVTATCCGMAGDRGLLHPELPASALAAEAAEVRAAGADRHVCSNRTCEIALHEVVGEPYESFLFVLEEATR